jgi:hypothetical protein
MNEELDAVAWYAWPGVFDRPRLDFVSSSRRDTLVVLRSVVILLKRACVKLEQTLV